MSNKSIIACYETFSFAAFVISQTLVQQSGHLLLVRPMKGRTAPASRCLWSALFGELTWANWSRKSLEDFAEEEADVEEEDEEVWPPLHSSPSQPEKGQQILFTNPTLHDVTDCREESRWMRGRCANSYF